MTTNSQAALSDNKDDLNEVDFLESLAKDEETTVVVGYLESISSGKEFLKGAREVTSAKPFILLRAGTTKAGIGAASAHTGTIAGADTAYAAAFRHAGVIRVESLDALFDCTAAFSTQPCPKGDRGCGHWRRGGCGRDPDRAREASYGPQYETCPA